MNAKQLAQIAGLDPNAFPDREVAAVTEDSRKVVPGAAFVAVKGEHADGHAFVKQAAQAGAVLIIGDRQGVERVHGVPYAYTPAARRAAGFIAHALAGDPSKAMIVAGVTGTNGKSTCVALVHHMLTVYGYAAGKLGTLGYDVDGEVRRAHCTTPFAEEIAALMARAREAGRTHMVMEVSSHALDQERVAGIAYNVGAFTNLTQDHLDYHKDMEAYRRAKLKLFDRVEGPGAFTVVCRDDPSAEAFIAASNVPCYTVGRGGDCRAEAVRAQADGTEFRARTPWGDAEVRSRLVGMHNVANVLASLAVCGGLGISVEAAAASLTSFDGVPGRFESVDEGQPFQVIVDYAHTEDGLRNVLRTARELCCGRVIVVFGCGGDRDRMKRPRMGAAVAELADFAVVTSDNPRTEDPERIIRDVEPGLRNAGKHKEDDYEIMGDRTEAIRRAIEVAKPGDLVMIAGKGHEDYQILGTRRVRFDDREVARRILKEL